MNKAIFSIVLILTLSTAIQLGASWMGVTWLWVKVNKVYEHKEGSQSRKVTLKILYWGRGGGHGTTYGKKFPGKEKTVDLIMKSEEDALNLKQGQAFWVKHRSSTYFTVNQETGKRESGHSSSWNYLGDIIDKPLSAIRGAKPEKVNKEKEIKLLWSIQHNQILSLKIQYKTLWKFFPKFKLILDERSADDSDNLKFYLTYTMDANYQYENQRSHEDHLLQFNLKEFKGKNMTLYFANKELISLKIKE